MSPSTMRCTCCCLVCGSCRGLGEVVVNNEVGLIFSSSRKRSVTLSPCYLINVSKESGVMREINVLFVDVIMTLVRVIK